MGRFSLEKKMKKIEYEDLKVLEEENPFSDSRKS